MKQYLLFLMALMVSMTTEMRAEESRTVLVREGVVWNYRDIYYSDDGTPVSYCMEFSGDREINGKNYKCLWRYYADEELNTAQMQPVAFMREDGRKVYAVLNNQYDWNDDYLDLLKSYDSWLGAADGEKLAYDFDEPANSGALKMLYSDADFFSFKRNETWIGPDGTAELWMYSSKMFTDIDVDLLECIGVDAHYYVSGDVLSGVHTMLTRHPDARPTLVSVVCATGGWTYYGRGSDRYAGPRLAYTGIETVKSETDGDGHYYDLQGRPVQHPQPGTPYIHNRRVTLP